ncbi:MAG: flavin reductase family protein [Bacteroidales bacterium]|nr:flavin reductase family protein [Bacteroidales bacterium]
MKENWKPGTLVYPLPAVLVSCGTPEVNNLFTVAWTGTVCTNPAMLYISVRPERYSYSLIKKTMEFTVNLTTEKMAKATDFCGVRSGRDMDKWKATGLHRHPGHSISCPAVEESPISIECRVKSIIPLGSHDMFIAEVVNVMADTEYMEEDTGRFRLDKAHLINYSHGGYFAQGEQLGTFGFSVKKK